MKCYKICVKCGHVRRNKYILKYVYLKAEDGKDAAKKARLIPRVKHDHKDAIRSVKEINFEEYINGIKVMYNDNYFKVYNRKDQLILNAVDFKEIIDEDNEIKKYKVSHARRYLKEKEYIKEYKKEISNGGYLEYYG